VRGVNVDRVVAVRTADTRYGYICCNGNHVEKFVEKPDGAQAQKYLQDSRYLINSGLFLFRNGDFLQEVRLHSPEIIGACERAFEDKLIDGLIAVMKADIPQAMIDAANLRALVRAERMHMDPGFLQEVLFEGGSVTPDAIRAGASEPAALFRSTALREAAELGEAAVKGGSLTDFEKACDNAVLRTAAGARRVPFGVEVALGYLIAKEAEWTAVRIVMAGRLAGLSADAIRERLRDTYV
ncbi:MAG: hypothetical protein EGQ66_08070, partial [Coriobacteriaceae bacterium]|nr:hypothetical protein [Coriobacteriaceae bacterium]